MVAPDHLNSDEGRIFCKHGAHDGDLCRVFDAPRRAALDSRLDFLPLIVTETNFASVAPELASVEVIFATWGLWRLEVEQLDALPNLKAVFYAAGSVKPFAAPLLERDILLVSAWAANAVPVAEWTLAQILLANKGFFPNTRAYRGPQQRDAFRGRGNYGATVSIWGLAKSGVAFWSFCSLFAYNHSFSTLFSATKEPKPLVLKKSNCATPSYGAMWFLITSPRFQRRSVC